MKVLVVSNMYPTQARPYFGIFVARQVEALRREGVDLAVEIIAGDRGELDYFFSRARIARAMRVQRPDVVHCHYGYTPLAVAFMGLPYVVTLCGDDLNGESDGRGGITLKSRVGVLVSQLLALGAARVVVQSEAMRARLWGPARTKTEVLAMGVDESEYSPGSMGVARQRLGIDPGALVIGFVNSKGQRTKRLDLALATRDELARRGHRVQLLVAETVAPAETPWYYRASDCLLMTSDLEGSPNCVKEALACGVPVVSVPVGDIPEIIDTPARGRIVGRDPVQLGDAVESLWRERQPLPMSLLPDRLKASNVAQRLVAIYQDVCEERRISRAVAVVNGRPRG